MTKPTVELTVNTERLVDLVSEAHEHLIAFQNIVDELSEIGVDLQINIDFEPVINQELLMENLDAQLKMAREK